MTTYRERRLAKAERLRDWADGREAKSDAAYAASHAVTDQIPFGQPILVGHHSERGHRNALARADAAMGASVEHSHKAEEMRSRAENIESQARHAIYDDDPDAIERLRAKLTSMESSRDAMKVANATYRKEHRAELKELSAYQRHEAMPYPSWKITNLTGNIGRAKERIASLERGPVDRAITARFDSSCELCGAELHKGDRIRYNRQQGARCVTCPTSEEG